MIESEQHSERAELAVTHASVHAQKADRNAIHVCVCRYTFPLSHNKFFFTLTQTRLLKKQQEESVHLIYVLKRISKWLSVFKWFNH